MAGPSTRISEVARGLVLDRRNDCLFSVISGWEIAIKAGLGKLKLCAEAGEYIRPRVRAVSKRVLPCSLDHVLALAKLPEFHLETPSTVFSSLKR